MKRMLLLLVLAACGEPQQTAAVCTTPRPNLKSGRPVSPEQWYRFLVDRALDGGVADCTGAPVKWRDLPRCDEQEPSDALPTTPFVEDDLVVAKLGEGSKLVWVVTTHYASGEGLGPVALVRETPAELEVLAVGSLRARPRHARLRLTQLGKGTFLEAEGESCVDDKDPESCRRSVSFLVQDHARFAPVTLVRTDGSCLGPGQLDLARRGEQPLKNGWKRRFELNASTSYAHDVLTVQEQVAVSDYDPQKPGVPPRPVRRADAQRSITFQRGRLVASDTSLWSRVTAADQGE